ncbi:uncharacterized protein EAE98_005897 [Botrytis deweyae]|uniref:RBR-type E3 ubiquitin transferase n=1 Tax=Botrytis deweyae TaxID=2478750 RepID=A0ABQ7IL31_9HELO|nr:uncharacterized protein EAE98_005897 [Botrytis deweyae]KAF7927515.1 hypothetical protein EAE98_005897 [Botrytis deweyae]
MAFDYQSGKVFGLNFKEHDARKMRYVLKNYQKLPENQGDRLALFLRLQTFETSLDEEVSVKVKEWFENGGDLPSTHPVTAPAEDSSGEDGEDEDDEEEEEEEEGSDDESSSDSGVSANSGDELLWEDREEALRRNPGMDLFDLFPQHPDNPERDNYIFGAEPDNGEFGMEPNSTDDEENSESEEESEDKTESEDEDDEEDDEDDDDDEENGEDEEEETKEEPESGKAHDHSQKQSDKVECVICAEDVLIVNTWSDVTGDCHHRDTFICKECLDLSITTDIEYGLLNGIKCPLCTAVLTDHDVRRKASPGVLERYFYLREKASRPDTFVMCLGPKCGGGQIHEGPEPLMICDHCKFKTCVKHQLPWHEGQSCDEFDVDDSQIERLEQEEATAKLLAKDSRICPKCKECVVRSDGCDHMQCRCGNSWCYLCGVDWENILRLGDAAHGRNCPNHPDSYKRTRGQNLANETALTNLVHGRPVNEAQTRAKYAKQAARRETMRPLALAAAEQRMKEQALAKSDSDSSKSGPPKKKTKLVSAWEEK